ncbi:hypothetical protein CC80DRAFT_549228 [Byssothecium circinans]|uniref:Uncharacterized protein n=1 Tax=Byssothecium circinans TaxID=147558 RepID=A0A6A5TUV7_9PLEO|nr:hypothetical protein CC80DRAFT_549228 [Byssothecium circinans]
MKDGLTEDGSVYTTDSSTTKIDTTKIDTMETRTTDPSITNAGTVRQKDLAIFVFYEPTKRMRFIKTFDGDDVWIQFGNVQVKDALMTPKPRYSIHKEEKTLDHTVAGKRLDFDTIWDGGGEQLHMGRVQVAWRSHGWNAMGYWANELEKVGKKRQRTAQDPQSANSESTDDSKPKRNKRNHSAQPSKVPSGTSTKALGSKAKKNPPSHPSKRPSGTSRRHWPQTQPRQETMKLLHRLSLRPKSKK